jgi:hypothetical protein
MEDMRMDNQTSSAMPARNELGNPETDDESAMVQVIGIEQGQEPRDEDDGYSSKELKLAKRFVELVGGADRAQALLDKVSECEECLDLIDDENCDDGSCSSDEDMIMQLAKMMPMLFPQLCCSLRF